MPAPKLHHIKETCLYVKDLEKSRFFYEEILGLERIVYDAEKYLFLKIGMDVLLLFNSESSSIQADLPSHEGYGRLHIAFETSVEEYKKWKKHLAKHQISIEFEKQWPRGGFSFYFRDPDDLCIEIIQPKVWE